MTVRCLVEPGVEHLHDVRVLQPGGRDGLSAEARDERLVVGQVLCQQLHCDAALEHRVHGHEHGGHAAGAEAALDHVAARNFGGRAHGLVAPPGPVPPFGGTTPPGLEVLVDVLEVEVLVLVELVVVVMVVVGVVLDVVDEEVVVVCGFWQSRSIRLLSRVSPDWMLAFTSGSTLEGRRLALSWSWVTSNRAPLQAPLSKLLAVWSSWVSSACASAAGIVFFCLLPPQPARASASTRTVPAAARITRRDRG